MLCSCSSSERNLEIQSDDIWEDLEVKEEVDEVEEDTKTEKGVDELKDDSSGELLERGVSEKSVVEETVAEEIEYYYDEEYAALVHEIVLQIFTDIENDNFAGSYSNLSSIFQMLMTFEEWADFVSVVFNFGIDSLTIEKMIPVFVEPPKIESEIMGDLLFIDARYLFKDESYISVILECIEEDGDWKINFIDMHFISLIDYDSLGRYGEVEIPDDEEIKALTQASMDRLLVDLQKGDLTETYDQFAETVKAAISKEAFENFLFDSFDLLSTYSSIDYSDIDDSTIVFITGPEEFEGEFGIVVIESVVVYKEMPDVKFSVSYLFEDSEWKLGGIHFDMF